MDISKMMDAKVKTVGALTGGIEGLFKKNKVEYARGWGSIKNANEVEVKAADGSLSTLKAKNIVIATGSDVVELPFLPFDEKRIVSSTGALELDAVPKNLVLVGGGVIGLELGSVWSRLGSNVTVIEFLDQIAFPADLEVARTLQKILKKQGLKFEMKRKVVKADIGAGGIKVHTEAATGGKPKAFDADVVLVSVGRKPNTKGLGLENVGLQTDEQGKIEVDDALRTKVPNIFAIGDVIRGPMLAHKAEEEGVAVAETISGVPGHVAYEACPSILYTYPEVAWVGKTEEQLKAEGVKYKKGTFPMLANSRAKANQESDGFVKVLTDAETDRLLGMHIVSSLAGDLISSASIGMEYGASSEDIARFFAGHPSTTEAVKGAAQLASFGKAINF